MKRTLRLMLTVLVGLGLAAVGANEASAQKKKHDPVTFITGSTTGTWYPIGAAIADITNAQYEAQPISVIPGTGGVGNPLSVGTGKADIGISFGPFAKLAQQGNNEMYEGKGFPELRAIAAMTMTSQHLVMAEPYDINTLKTAKEKKPKVAVGSGEKGSTNQFSFVELLGYYGVTFKDIDGWGGVVSKVPSTGAADAYQNRQLDIVNIFINHPNAKLSEMMRARPSRLVSLPKDARDALVKKWGFVDFVIPANSYPNQPQNVETLGLPFMIFATTKLDAEMAYLMTKQIAENKDRMEKAHPSFKEWQPTDMPKGLGVEMHEGAARYYKERGWVK